MKIKILGTRGEIDASAPYHARHSGVLIDRRLMLDLGEREFLKYKPKWILFTHLHPDHAFFVRQPAAEQIDIPMFAPESYRDDGIDVRKINSGSRIGSYDIRPVPTIHSHRVKSQGYIVANGDGRILYTGDMVWINNWYNRYFKKLDLVITEASFIRKDGMIRRHKDSGRLYGHAGVPRLVNHFSRFCGHIVLMHYGSWFYRDNEQAHRKVNRLAREHNVRIDVGYDGMELEI